MYFVCRKYFVRTAALLPGLLSVVLLTVYPSRGAEQLRQLAIIGVPGQPGFDSLAFAGGMLVMTHSAAGSVDVFDPARRRILARITGLQSPRGMAVDETAGKVYVADAGTNSILVISADNWKVADSISVPAAPGELLLDGSGKELFWIGTGGGTISLLALATRVNAGSVEVEGSPSHMALDPDHQVLYVTIQDQREVVAVNPQLRIVNRYKLNASQPTGLTCDARTKCLNVAVRYAVVSFNTNTGAEVNRVPATAGVDTLWLDPESRTVYAAGGGSLLLIRADGQRLAIADEISPDGKGTHGRL